MKNNNFFEKFIGELENYDSFNNELALKNVFNRYISDIYSNLLFYFDELTATKLYNEIYDFLSNKLKNAVERKYNLTYYQIGFCIDFEQILDKLLIEYNIDIFSPDCKLSNCKFTDIQKFILKNDITSIFLNKNDIVNINDKKKYVCEVLDISRIKYKLELLKIDKEIYRIKKEKGKTKIKKK